MRSAMVQAPIGDDVYGEDPSVRNLESLAAAKVGKEAGLFVASGTMGNLVAILGQANRGDEAIVGQDTHSFRKEAGGMSVLGGVAAHPVTTDAHGRMELERLEAAVNPDDAHLAISRLILLENSYAARSGAPISPGYFVDVKAIAQKHDLSIHLDGARLFNATAALGVDAVEITKHVDTVSFCLSKGLCAPVGSVVCGSAQFIRRAHRIRKQVGGGMRQAGVIAAAGIVALNEMVDRLAEDNANARLLAEGLSDISGIVVNPSEVKTNIVFIALSEEETRSAHEIARILWEKAGVLIGVKDNRSFRAVTHYWVGQGEIETLLDGFRKVCLQS